MKIDDIALIIWDLTCLFSSEIYLKDSFETKDNSRFAFSILAILIVFDSN